MTHLKTIYKIRRIEVKSINDGEKKRTIELWIIEGKSQVMYDSMNPESSELLAKEISIETRLVQNGSNLGSRLDCN